MSLDTVSTLSDTVSTLSDAVRVHVVWRAHSKHRAGIPSMVVSPSHSTLQTQGRGSQYPRLTYCVPEQYPTATHQCLALWHCVLLGWGTLSGGSVRLNTVDMHVDC